MTKKELTRAEKIERLIANDVALIHQDPEFLEEILSDGHIGYTWRSDKEIDASYRELLDMEKQGRRL